MSEWQLYNLTYFGPWLIGIAICFGIFINGFVKRNEPAGRRNMAQGCGCGALLLVILAMALPSSYQDPERAKEAVLKGNLHTIQVGVEHWAIEHGYYPSNINQLIEDGVITEFPSNPFDRQPMKEVDFDRRSSNGEFSYIPFSDSTGIIKGYYLLVYGTFDDDLLGWDVTGDGVEDNVLLVLDSYSRPFTNELGQEIDPPTIKDLVNPDSESVGDNDSTTREVEDDE